MFHQYNNISTHLHKYLKEKKKHKPITEEKKKKKKTVAIVITVPLGTVVLFKTWEKKKKRMWLTKPNSKMKVFVLSPYKPK